MHNRQNALNIWLGQVLKSTSFNLTPLTGDASFRRYYRLQHNNKTRIVMDAPPDKETMQPFVTVGNLLQSQGIHTPHIHAVDLQQGFAVLDDLGDTLLLSKLNTETAHSIYLAALKTLTMMQQCDATALPVFDQAFMVKEMNLFTEWFVHAYLQLTLSPSEENLIANTFDWLSNELSRQPTVFIHRDYHSRNIMLLDNSPPVALGIIDFQDAMLGPFTYDLVSLLKDCYIQWPREPILNWLSLFYEQSDIAQQWSLADFTRAFDLCGLQRHIKVLGVFSRLYLRDNKPNYLNDLPLTLNYVMACLESYEELHPFYQFMNTRISLP